MKTSTIKKQTVTTIIIAVCTIVLIILYFAVLSPLLNSTTEENGAPALLNGESLGTQNRIFLYEYMSPEDIKSVAVSNSYGEYSISLSDDGNYYIDDNKNAPYDTALFSSLCVSVGYSLSMKRILPSPEDGKEPESIDFSIYSLDEENACAHYTVTSKTGNSYTVWIGDEIVSEQGYYARLEGRNAVYIIGNDIKNTVLSPIESIVTPMITLPTSSQDYYKTDYFTVWKKGEHFVTVHMLSTQEELDKYATDTRYIMAYAQNVKSSDVTEAQTLSEVKKLLGDSALKYNYTPAIDEYAAVLEKFSNFKGESTVKLIEPLKENADEKETEEYVYKVNSLLSEYGINLTKPAYELFFNYNGVNNYAVFSEKNANGNYYAFSYTFGLIAEIAADDLAFLDWSFEEWVESAFFQKNITKVGKISLYSPDASYDFTLTHTDGNSANDKLSVKEENSAKAINTAQFREFFKVLLTREIRGKFEGEIPDESKLMATLTITSVGGSETEYKFYQSSTQRAYMTINGEGEFYTLTSGVKKMLSDASKLLTGEEIHSEELN